MLLTAALVLVMGSGFTNTTAYAASGAVYTCTIHPCYRHPVTGVIEDSGGEASYATGQGMVEGCIYTTGIMEVTSDGNYYLTIRMSLMDYTSNHSFWVQNVGDSGWSSPAMGATGTGTDTNGTTTDICIQVPSENCVVRGAMYVEPMGRDVVFYLYPSDYVQGNNTDMNSTMITGDSQSGTDGSASGGTDNGGNSDTSGSTDNGNNSSAAGGTGSSLSGGSGLTASNASLQSDGGADGAEAGESEETDESTQTPLQSTITEEAQSDTTQQDEDSTLNSAQGLSLSTEEEAAAEGQDDSQAALGTVGQQILIRTVSMTVTGLILLAAGAGIVYLFRKNWYRWGGAEDDDDYDDSDGE